VALLPFTLKSKSQGKQKEEEEELWENSNISPGKKYNLPKILYYKENPKILQDINYHNSIITNLKFQHKPKIYIYIYHLSKILI
jgi:hypothetical protein